jgi:hypothetical protein
MKLVNLNPTKEVKYPYTWVTLYNPDTEEKTEIAHFEDFHKATEFMLKEEYSVVYLDDDRKNQGQLWGVRKWTKR